MGARGWKKKAGAYDRIDSIADIKKFSQRRRKRHMVILSEKFVKKHRPNCVRCGRRITVRQGNRTNIFPKGRVEPMHYNCAWGSIFQQIGKLSTAYSRGVFDIHKGRVIKLPKSILDESA